MGSDGKIHVVHHWVTHNILFSSAPFNTVKWSSMLSNYMQFIIKGVTSRLNDLKNYA